jgi:hypothetical protein
MLVASRDPFHPGALDVSKSQSNCGIPRFTRAMNVLQIVGTILAIPVGLGSAYTMYRANFSIDSTCQSLRANIVTMLDKHVDASARHMLVRRDIEAFGRNCGIVDPDATAAFKALLESEKTVSPVAATTAKSAEAQAEAVIRKAERGPAVAAKQPAEVQPQAAVIAAAASRNAPSDAAWIAAVRQALVSHPGEPKPDAEQVKAAVAMPPPAESAMPVGVTLAPSAVLPSVRGIRPAAETQIPAISLSPPPPERAPALPSATPVAIAPTAQADDGHPVPPGLIPNEAPVISAKADDHTGSRLGELAAKIPLVGWAVNR